MNMIKPHVSLGVIVVVVVVAAACVLSGATALDVRFDDPASGFFLRERHHTYGTSSGTQGGVGPTTSIILGKGAKRTNQLSRGHAVIHSERFSILGKSHPITIRAEYGPFQTSQTLPAQYALLTADEDYPKSRGAQGLKGMISDFKPHSLDLSAHLVTQEIPKDRPTLRVLFHAGGNYLGLAGETLCVRLMVKTQRDSPTSGQSGTQVSTQCVPSRKDGTCLAEVHLPMSWWPQEADLLPGEYRTKVPPVSVDAIYSVFKSRGQICAQEDSTGDNNEGRLGGKVVPNTLLGSVPLTPATHGFRQVGHDEVLHMLVPDVPIYPTSRLVIPVYLNDYVIKTNVQEGSNLSVESLSSHLEALTIRLRTRSGIKLTGLEECYSEYQQWSTSLEINSRGTSALLRILRVPAASELAARTDGGSSEAGDVEANQNKANHSTLEGEDDDHDEDDADDLLQVDDDAESQPRKEQHQGTRGKKKRVHSTTQNTPLFYWVFEVDGKDYDSRSKGKISWQVSYQRRSNSSWSETNRSINLDQYRVRAKVDVHKDDVQAAIPILKQTELMNLAVLTGRQVSRPLKVFMVSHGGQIADVTLHSSCSSKDESVLKVTASCTSVYVDGSEKRGALSAGVQVKYGSLVGETFLTLWMADWPLKVEVGDARLSVIKDWKVSTRYLERETSASLDLVPSQQGLPRKKRETLQGLSKIFGLRNLTGTQKTPGPSQCRTRFQQTTFRVFANFVAEDPDSGRKDYFPSRSVELDVTDVLGRSALRVEDPSIVSLSGGNTLEGRKVGRTEVQVISPITGEVLGNKEIRVSKNKESIVGINVNVLSGLQLDVVGEKRGRKGIYLAKTTYSKALTSQYQEGLLDIELNFSDNTVLNLRDINPSDYYLNVKSLDQKVIAFAPTQGSRHPRVIAIGSGQGQLLRVFLELSDDCMQKSMVPLATTKVDVHVQLKEKKPVFDGSIRHDFGTAQAVNMGDLGDSLLSNIALRDDQNYFKPAMSNNGVGSNARRHITNKHNDIAARLTPLEVGMFVLVAVFCAAMAMFVASCFVYASRYRSREYPLQRKSQSVQNAHDWVWLGKTTSTSSKSSSPSTMSKLIIPVRRGDQLDLAGQEKRKSQRLSYVGSEINIIPNPQTDEYEAEVSNPNSPDDAPLEAVEGIPNITAHDLYSELPRRSSQGHNGARRKTKQRDSPQDSLKPKIPPKRLAGRRAERPSGGFPMEATRCPPEYVRPCRTRMGAMQSQEDEEQTAFLPTVVDSATYTRNETSPRPGHDILPVGYPLFLSTGLGGCEAISCDTLPSDMEEDLRQGIRSASMLSPLELPDPSKALLASGLRQSPASALPPLCESKDFITTSPMDTLPRPVRGTQEPLPSAEDCHRSWESESGSGIPKNPNLDRPSPPRHGSGSRLFENPFDLTDEESAPILPEKLSPNHIFESRLSDFEDDATFTPPHPCIIDSSTFIRPKPALLPISSPVGGAENSFSEDLDCSDMGELEDESVNMELDYGELMSYFESLKESNA